MNIVKFKDSITESEFYNQNIKGKYALVVNFLYIFPLNVVGLTDNLASTVALEQAQIHEMPEGEINITLDTETFELFRNSDYLLFSEYESLISEIESIDKYIHYNEFTPDDDITMEELKRFRTWLAEVLIANEPWIESWSKDPDKQKAMLNYYVQEMYDDVVKSLTKFSSYVDLNAITSQSGCGCGNKSVSLTQLATTTCDPLLIYRHNIYKYMIEIFSDLTYWTGQVEICEEMKKYIDNIIKCNLPLTSTTLYSNFADCTCLNSNNSEQDSLMNILKRLSIALEYIIEDHVSGNRNYISSVFLDWSTYLYERMRW